MVYEKLKFNQPDEFLPLIHGSVIENSVGITGNDAWSKGAHEFDI